MTYVGLFFNNCMPQSTGGDVIKAYYVATSHEKSAHGVAAVVMDRVTGLLRHVHPCSGFSMS